MSNIQAVAVGSDKLQSRLLMLSAFVKPRSGGFTKGSYQRAVASGFLFAPIASVLHTIVRPQPGGVEEKGDSVCHWLGGSSRIIRATGRIVKSGAHREFGGMTIPSGGRTLFLLTLYGVGGSLGRKVTHVPFGMFAMKQKMGCYE